MPGYTHTQRAQPVTLGHHLLAYVSMFERDVDRLQQRTRGSIARRWVRARWPGRRTPIDRAGRPPQDLGFQRDHREQHGCDLCRPRPRADTLYCCATVAILCSRLCEGTGLVVVRARFGM